jgi:hypothetical protein
MVTFEDFVATPDPLTVAELVRGELFMCLSCAQYMIKGQGTDAGR